MDRLGEENISNQGCLMKIIEYIDSSNIIVEFQDEYKTRVNRQYCNFKSGSIKNPYAPSIHGVGIIGNKYPVWENGRPIKEYSIWATMMKRCFYDKCKDKQPTYSYCP